MFGNTFVLNNDLMAVQRRVYLFVLSNAKTKRLAIGSDNDTEEEKVEGG